MHAQLACTVHVNGPCSVKVVTKPDHDFLREPATSRKKLFCTTLHHIKLYNMNKNLTLKQLPNFLNWSHLISSWLLDVPNYNQHCSASWLAQRHHHHSGKHLWQLIQNCCSPWNWKKTILIEAFHLL